MRSWKISIKVAKQERAQAAATAREYLRHWRNVACKLPTPLRTGAQAYALHKWLSLTLAPLGQRYPWPLDTRASNYATARTRRYVRGTLKLNKRRRRLLEYATALSDVFALRVVFATWRRFHRIIRTANHVYTKIRCQLVLRDWDRYTRRLFRVRGAAAHLRVHQTIKLQLQTLHDWLAASKRHRYYRRVEVRMRF